MNAYDTVIGLCTFGKGFGKTASGLLQRQHSSIIHWDEGDFYQTSTRNWKMYDTVSRVALNLMNRLFCMPEISCSALMHSREIHGVQSTSSKSFSIYTWQEYNTSMIFDKNICNFCS